MAEVLSWCWEVVLLLDSFRDRGLPLVADASWKQLCAAEQHILLRAVWGQLFQRLGAGSSASGVANRAELLLCCDGDCKAQALAARVFWKVQTLAPTVMGQHAEAFPA